MCNSFFFFLIRCNNFLIELYYHVYYFIQSKSTHLLYYTNNIHIYYISEPFVSKIRLAAECSQNNVHPPAMHGLTLKSRSYSHAEYFTLLGISFLCFIEHAASAS